MPQRGFGGLAKPGWPLGVLLDGDYRRDRDRERLARPSAMRRWRWWVCRRRADGDSVCFVHGFPLSERCPAAFQRDSHPMIDVQRWPSPSAPRPASNRWSGWSTWAAWSMTGPHLGVCSARALLLEAALKDARWARWARGSGRCADGGWRAVHLPLEAVPRRPGLTQRLGHPVGSGGFRVGDGPSGERGLDIGPVRAAPRGSGRDASNSMLAFGAAIAVTAPIATNRTCGRAISK